MAKHTPWREGAGEAEILNVGGEIVALVVSEPSQRAAIVRAVNAHDALTAVLDRIIQDVDSGWATEAGERFPWLADARAALELAEGKEA